MIIITSDEMKRIETLAIEQGFKAEAFMQQAGKNIALETICFIEEKKIPKTIILLIGKGNNGGDAYVAGRYLLEQEFDVKAYQILDDKDGSDLLKIEKKRYEEMGGHVENITSTSQMNFEKALILDGLLGTGCKGEITGFLLDVIKYVNHCKNLVISIDIPSGVNGNTGITTPIAIDADVTLFLGLAKLGCFINDGPKYIGKLKYVDFGLPKEYIEKAKKVLIMNDDILKDLLPKIDRTRHKYQAGFVAAIAGSKGMYGAAKLAAIAALRSGCGIVKMLSQKEIQNLPLELVNIIEENFDKVLQICNKADSVFIGPGLGRGKDTGKFLLKLIPKIESKCVIDADGLYFLANNSGMKLPKDCVLTPHKKEMMRLLNIDQINEEKSFIEKCIKFSQDKNSIIVLKGYPTFIFHPNKDPLLISRGDPGMATAGTGDVLTGIIASFLAQGMDTYEASYLAVNIHCIAAEIAAIEKTSYSMIASDIIEYLPKAFKSIT